MIKAAVAHEFGAPLVIEEVQLRAPEGSLAAAGLEHLLGYFSYSRGFKSGGFNGMAREDGVMFRVEGETLPAEGAQVLQGFLEGSNVNTIHQLARMIEVQRAYEMGQSFLDNEDKRIRAAIDNLMKS